MKIPKAIEILYIALVDRQTCLTSDFFNAAKLSIEALNRIEDWRAGKVLNPDFLLPGEDPG